MCDIIILLCVCDNIVREKDERFSRTGTRTTRTVMLRTKRMSKFFTSHYFFLVSNIYFIFSRPTSMRLSLVLVIILFAL